MQNALCMCSLQRFGHLDRNTKNAIDVRPPAQSREPTTPRRLRRELTFMRPSHRCGCNAAVIARRFVSEGNIEQIAERASAAKRHTQIVQIALFNTAC